MLKLFVGQISEFIDIAIKALIVKSVIFVALLDNFEIFTKNVFAMLFFNVACISFVVFCLSGVIQT